MELQLLKVLPCKIIFFENQDDLCFLWDFGLQILTPWPFHFFPLAYFKPIHLISIKFQNIENNLDTTLKNFFISFNCYNLAILVVTLTETISTNYSDGKVQGEEIPSHFKVYIQGVARKGAKFMLASSKLLFFILQGKGCFIHGYWRYLKEDITMSMSTKMFKPKGRCTHSQLAPSPTTVYAWCSFQVHWRVCN